MPEFHFRSTLVASQFRNTCLIFGKMVMPQISRLIFSCILIGFSSKALFAAELKRRVLVLPFDNLQKNKDVAWMSDSIADNLKTDLLKSDRFEILDVALLRKIDAGIQFQNLNATNASAFARRLNCEVAVVGRFTVRKEGRQWVVNFEAEGVDALEERSVVTLKQEARVDGSVFDKVEHLAAEISDELKLKLKPLDADSFKRDNKLEVLIRRLENPPKGFLDNLQIVGFKLNPTFDIDTFEYRVEFNYEEVERFKEIDLRYMYWGRQYEPAFAGSHDLSCKANKCKIMGSNPILALAKSEKESDIVYKVRLNLPDPRGPIVARWWLQAGYPYMKSLNVFGQSNPSAIEPGSKLQLEAMRGYALFEAGILPGRWQFLPAQLRWALTMQAGYGQGDMAQYLADNPTKVKIHFLSLGAGVRIDRPIAFGRSYSLAPFMGYITHYQRFFRQIDTGFLETVGFSPEIGINQYFRLGLKSPWYLMTTLAVGSYIYSGENLTYLRGSVGVEYVIK